MATIIVYSYDDLTTLERGYISNPIDMPFSETMDRKEYILSTEAFLREYNNWDRDANPMLGLNDELSRLEIWLSQPKAERVKQAIDEGKDSVDLAAA
jgi:hypothetical protein